MYCGCQQCTKIQQSVGKKETNNRKKIAMLLLVTGWTLLVFLVFLHPQKDESYNQYEILNVSQLASEQEIKKQFRKLSIKYHPDKATEENKGKSEKNIYGNTKSI
eukprot:GHVR01040925.1.p1 GENE.GHVR01040925.1~~GHVR01040925.1.p1  ORF type:complete len:105 (-),score=18.05 GHVR01040925.1:53-367(-)